MITESEINLARVSGNVEQENLKLGVLVYGLLKERDSALESLKAERKRREQMLDLQSRNASLEEALKMRRLKEDGKRNPFAHNCHWCSNCVSRLESMEIEALQTQAGESSTGREDTGN